MSKIKLILKLSEFDQLHELVDNKKKSVKVDADILRRLLCDHSVMIGKLNDEGVTVIDDVNTMGPDIETTPAAKTTKGKQWIVTDPDGVEQVVDNLTAFCKENGLTGSVMSGVANGKYKHHKQWKCEKIA